jgi:hypothetical protein
MMGTKSKNGGGKGTGVMWAGRTADEAADSGEVEAVGLEEHAAVQWRCLLRMISASNCGVSIQIDLKIKCSLPQLQNASSLMVYDIANFMKEIHIHL